MLVLEAADIAATEAIGRRLGERLFPGAVVGLIGPLGAGQDLPCPLDRRGTRRRSAASLEPDIRADPRIRGAAAGLPLRHLSPAERKSVRRTRYRRVFRRRRRLPDRVGRPRGHDTATGAFAHHDRSDERISRRIQIQANGERAISDSFRRRTSRRRVGRARSADSPQAHPSAKRAISFLERGSNSPTSFPGSSFALDRPSIRTSRSCQARRQS